MVHDAKVILLGKSDFDTAKRGFSNPHIALSPDFRVRQSFRPLREVFGIGGEFINIAREAINVDAYVFHFMHGEDFLWCGRGYPRRIFSIALPFASSSISLSR